MLGLEIKTGDFRNLDTSKLSATKYVEFFPGVIFSKRGSPLVGGGTWLHPDLDTKFISDIPLIFTDIGH